MRLLPSFAYIAAIRVPGQLLFMVLCSDAFAQGTRADYQRADRLRELTQRKVYKTKVEPHWLSDRVRFWYRNDLPDNRREFVLIDAEKGTRIPAFDHARLAAALSEAARQQVRAD